MNDNKNETVKDGITVLIVEPLKKPYIKMISKGLKVLQNEVGGNIEVIFPFEDSVTIVLNSDGKFRGLMPNRALYDCEGQLCDVIEACDSRYISYIGYGRRGFLLSERRTGHGVYGKIQSPGKIFLYKWSYYSNSSIG